MGIIGLTVIASYLEVFIDVVDYEAAIRSNIDDVRNAGADVVIVLAHLGSFDLKTIAKNVADLNIALFLGGHDHQSKISLIGASYVVESGKFNEKFAKIELLIDIDTNSFSFIAAPILIDNIEGVSTANQDIQKIINNWKDKYNIDEVITKTSIDIPKSGTENLVSDSFLHYFRADRGNEYNFGATFGGASFRDRYRTGDITIGDIISVNPFDNYLLNVTMSGNELITMLRTGIIVYSGIYQIGSSVNNLEILIGNEYLPIDINANYTGLMSTFLYDNIFSDKIEATETGVHYRDAIICYYRKIDDLANFDDEKYNPQDHGANSCPPTIYTFPTSTSLPAQKGTNSSTLLSENSNREKSTFWFTPNMLLIFTFILIYNRKKS